MSYFTKFKLIADPRLSMSNFWDKAVVVYGNSPLAYLDEPLQSFEFIVKRH